MAYPVSTLCPTCVQLLRHTQLHTPLFILFFSASVREEKAWCEATVTWSFCLLSSSDILDVYEKNPHEGSLCFRAPEMYLWLLQQMRLDKGICANSPPEDWNAIPRTKEVFNAEQPPARKEGGTRIWMPLGVSSEKDFQTLGQRQWWLVLPGTALSSKNR